MTRWIAVMIYAFLVVSPIDFIPGDLFLFPIGILDDLIYIHLGMQQWKLAMQGQ